jgi:transcriptional regulator with XRE-family HTH domain
MISFNMLSPRAMALQIAHRVRVRRLARGWTRRELAERTGIPTPTLRKFEADGQIQLARLLQIAAVLDASREFETLFAAPVPTSLDQLAPRPERQRGRAKRAAHQSRHD